MYGNKRTYSRAITPYVSKASKRRKYTVKKKPRLQRIGRLLDNTVLARGQYLKAILKYTDTVQMNPGAAGTANHYVFAANGLYDPNITGGGHQPAGFDQYMTLYELFTVTRAHIKVNFQSADSTNVQLVGIANRDLATTNPDFGVYIENGGFVWTRLGRAGSGNDICTLTQYMDMKKFGTYKDLIDNDDNAGTDSTNPSELQYFHVVMAAGDASTDTAGGWITVEITYEVIFRQPRQASYS